MTCRGMECFGVISCECAGCDNYICVQYVSNALNGSIYGAFVWQPEEMFEWLMHCAAEAVMTLLRVAK